MSRLAYRKVKIISAVVAVSLWCLGSTANAVAFAPLDAAEARNRCAAVDQEAYPDADLVVVARQTHVEYQVDGTSEEWFEQYVKVLTERGRRDACTVSSSFTLPYNTTVFQLVEVISSDGSVRKVDIEKNVKETIDASQMASNIYNPNDRLLQVTIPGLVVGDTVHFITKDDFVKARVPGTFSDYVTFEETNPILYAQYTVVAPPSLPLAAMALRDEVEGTVTFVKTTEAGKIVYRWVAKNVPMAFAEPEMPPMYTQVQRLLVSTIADWREISRWYWRLSMPHIRATTPAMAAEVKRLTKGKATRDERIRAVFFWVSRNIRYLGITAESEAPGYEPHPASMTYDRRTGVCRDKAALLVAMLRLAGFEAYPVLIMNGPKKDPEVPQPFFNHAIACVRNKDGSYLLMDPTDENTRELFPSYLGNQSYLVATPSGETLMTSPVESALKNTMRISTEGAVDAMGRLSAKTSLTFGGVNDNAYRGHLMRLSSRERRLFFEKTLLRAVPGAVLEAFELRPGDLADVSRPLEAHLSFKAEGFLVRGTGKAALPLLRFGGAVGVLPYVTRGMGLRERRFPYVTETTCAVDESLSLRLDPSLGVAEVPGGVESRRSDGCRWKREMRVQGQRLEMRDTLSMDLTEYSPDAYRALQEVLAAQERSDRLLPTFKTARAIDAADAWYTGFASDAVVLSEKSTVTVGERGVAARTVDRTVKVLTYAGIRRSSELRIPYNPAWEEVRVEEAFVRSPKGAVHTIDPREINVMDQPWAGTAPRYPAGKILVVSFPGLEEGSTISYRYAFTSKGWNEPAFVEPFQAMEPVGDKTVRVECPPGVNLRVITADNGFGATRAWRPFPRGFVSLSQGEDRGMEVKILQAKNVPPAMREEMLPALYAFAPSMAVASMPTEMFAASMSEILARQASERSFASAKAREIVRGLSGDRERIEAVWRYVARHVRLVDIPLAESLPHMMSGADTTLADGYGHQADRAVLAAAMLTSLGFKTDFVLATSIPEGDPLFDLARGFPATSLFVSLLVRVSTPSGDISIGDTDQYAPLGATVHAGMYGLTLSSMAWETITVPSAEIGNKTETRVLMRVNASGDASVTFRKTYFGSSATSFIRAALEMTPEEKRRAFEEIVTSVSRSALATSPRVISVDRYPPSEEFSLEIKGYAGKSGDVMTVRIPWLMRALPLVSSEERVHPLFTGPPREAVVNIEIELPEETQEVVSMPMGAYAAAPAGTVSVSMEGMLEGEGSGRKVVISQRVSTKPGTVWPDRYPELVSTHKALSAADASLVVVRLGAGENRGGAQARDKE